MSRDMVQGCYWLTGFCILIDFFLQFALFIFHFNVLVIIIMTRNITVFLLLIKQFQDQKVLLYSYNNNKMDGKN